jgi:hypothetical protein
MITALLVEVRNKEQGTSITNDSTFGGCAQYVVLASIAVLANWRD